MALSDDLRKRVVEAVVLGGLSRNAGRQAFRCKHRKRGALGDALQDHGARFRLRLQGAIAGPAVSRRSATICSA